MWIWPQHRNFFLYIHMAFIKAFKDIKKKSRRRVIKIYKAMCKLGELTPSIFWSCLIAKSDPFYCMLLKSGVCSNIIKLSWCTCSRAIRFMLKRLLNVNPSHPGVWWNWLFFLYNYVHATASYIRYCLRITGMYTQRLPYKVYKMLLFLHNSKKSFWVSKYVVIIT